MSLPKLGDICQTQPEGTNNCLKMRQPLGSHRSKTLAEKRQGGRERVSIGGSMSRHTGITGVILSRMRGGINQTLARDESQPCRPQFTWEHPIRFRTTSPPPLTRALVELTLRGMRLAQIGPGGPIQARSNAGRSSSRMSHADARCVLPGRNGNAPMPKVSTVATYTKILTDRPMQVLTNSPDPGNRNCHLSHPAMGGPPVSSADEGCARRDDEGADDEGVE